MMRDRFPAAGAMTAVLLVLALGACASPTEPTMPTPRPQPCYWVDTPVSHLSRSVSLPASYVLCSGVDRSRDGWTWGRDELVA